MSLENAKGVFEVKGKQFELVSFTMGTSQATDGNNRPSATPVQTMPVIVVKSNENSSTLIEWAAHHNMKCDCSIKTRKPEEDQTERTIEFQQAFCVQLTTHFTSDTTMMEHFVISAEKTTIDGFELDQRWSK
jgi:hypothetical protein